jgi:hypothetical protein
MMNQREESCNCFEGINQMINEGGRVDTELSLEERFMNTGDLRSENKGGNGHDE